MTAEEINSKIDITWKAIALFEENGKFSMPELIDATGLGASDIYSFFPSKKSILKFYYPALVFQYWAMIEEIEDFGSFSLSEKFSNFIYTLFDMMDETPRFVNDTFERLVFSEGSASEFHKEVTGIFKHFLTSDGEIAVSAGIVMKDYFYSFLASQYLYVVRFWTNDDSEGKERTLALVDKLTSFIQEIIYNKTIDKGFDLIKYLFGSAGLGNNIPVVGDFITDFFKDKGEDSNE